MQRSHGNSSSIFRSGSEILRLGELNVFLAMKNSNPAACGAEQESDEKKRKTSIKKISGKNDSDSRLGGTLASCIHATMNGVQIMRVHDFNEISQGIKVFKSINK